MKIYKHNTFMTTNPNKIWDIWNTQHFEIKQKLHYTNHVLTRKTITLSHILSHTYLLLLREGSMQI